MELPPVPFLAGSPEVRFTNFRIWQIRQFQTDLDQARGIFPNATFGDCLYERQYSDFQPPAVGFGTIPEDVEDTLLLLRLYKPGDIAFVEVKVRRPDSTFGTQERYGATGDITSSLFYDFRLDSAAQWETFANQLRGSDGWNSDWFNIARHFFLYGGTKGFSVEWNEVDRIMYYMIALEAALVPEKRFVGSCLRKRALKLIAGDDSTLRLLRDLYDIRSTLAHGSQLGARQKGSLTANRIEIESVTRRVLAAAVRTIPAEKAARKNYLTSIYAPTDDDFALETEKSFDSIAGAQNKETLLVSLLKKESYSFWNLLKIGAAVIRR
jgi:hypothetical protein